ncbi:cytochrome C [Turicimonas muris]|uniref:cytochrome C n=1 Tax=Turicimonas muris TaxID=1796652 RepID=UPI002493DBE2|nr:cytochrome C [Turicimonas muris]
MLNIKTTVILTVFACLGFSSIAAAQDNVPVRVPEFLKNVPFKIEGVDGFLQSLGIDPKAEPKKFSKKELRNLAEANYNDKTAQHFMSVHAKNGVGCLSCHDQTQIKGTAWMAYISNPKMKQDCKDCHTVQADVFKHTDTHSELDCIACHMPTMPMPEQYTADQSKAASVALYRAHMYKINPSPDKTSYIPQEVEADGKKVTKYVLAKDEKGRDYVDLMWSCARNAPADWTVFEGKGCHSQYTSKLEEGLVYKDQKQIYGELNKWQDPIKSGYEEIRGATERINKLLEVTRLDRDQRTEVLSYVDLATQIADMIEKDGSWGAHAHNYLTQRLSAAQNYIRKAQDILDKGSFSKTPVNPLK